MQVSLTLQDGRMEGQGGRRADLVVNTGQFWVVGVSYVLDFF